MNQFKKNVVFLLFKINISDSLLSYSDRVELCSLESLEIRRKKLMLVLIFLIYYGRTDIGKYSILSNIMDSFKNKFQLIYN